MEYADLDHSHLPRDTSLRSIAATARGSYGSTQLRFVPTEVPYGPHAAVLPEFRGLPGSLPGALGASLGGFGVDFG